MILLTIPIINLFHSRKYSGYVCLLYSVTWMVWLTPVFGTAVKRSGTEFPAPQWRSTCACYALLTPLQSITGSTSTPEANQSERSTDAYQENMTLAVRPFPSSCSIEPLDREPSLENQYVVRSRPHEIIRAESKPPNITRAIAGLRIGSREMLVATPNTLATATTQSVFRLLSSRLPIVSYVVGVIVLFFLHNAANNWRALASPN